MSKVVGIRFKEVGKIYYFDPLDVEFKKGDFAIVETVRGIECGEVAMENRTIDDEEIIKPLKPIIRLATPEDLKTVENNKIKEKEAFEICLKKIENHKLDMKLVDVEYTFDGSKVLFYFTSDGRVDFRELVKDLASVFRIRIELRQIGVRDECKMKGGLGICGRPFCCSSYMNDFHTVSIKMAKEQGLSLNPTKISGTCGRLMCCLQYEQSTYEALGKNMPRMGALVKTPDGNGTVIETNTLKQQIKVFFKDSDGTETIHSYNAKDVRTLRAGKNTVSQEELEALSGLEKD